MPGNDESQGLDAHFGDLLEAAPDAMLIASRDGRILLFNGRTEQLFGYSREELLGASVDLLVPARLRDLHAAERQDYGRKPRPRPLASGLELPARRRDGTEFSAEISLNPLVTEGGTFITAAIRDVTARRRMEADERQALAEANRLRDEILANAELALRERVQTADFAAEVGAALASNDPLPSVLQRCAEAMVRHLDPAFARIWTVDEAGDTLELQASAGLYTQLDGGHSRVPVGRFKIGRIASERRPHLTNDVLDDPLLSDPDWARREGMVAFAGYPLVAGDDLVGVMAMFARHPLSRTVLGAMGAVADQIAVGVRRSVAERSLRDAQERLQRVVTSSPAVLFSMRPDGSLRPDGAAFTLSWISENVRDLTGFSAAEALEADWWALRLHPEDRDRVFAEVAATAGSDLLRHEYRFLRKDGAYVWVRAEIRFLHDATGTPSEAVGSWSDVTSLKDAERKLAESEAQYRFLFESNPHPMWVYDAETFAFLAVNEAAVRHYGYTREEFLARTILDIRPPEEVEPLKASLKEFREAHGDGPFDSPATFRHRKKDGTEIDVIVAASGIVFDGRKARLLLATDVTERQALEKQLLRAQKMEAVGQLAGGVAHDFNNLLGVITGYTELLMRGLPPDSRERKRTFEIKRAADRAAALTRQLLAFSRRQMLQPVVLDLNEVVAGVEKMLRRLISEDIQIVAMAGPGLGRVKADAGQIEQVLMNLAVNARDAMPTGGRLVIETSNVVLDESYTRTHPEVTPGRYVHLSVSDTGHGMDAATTARVFEPFFTTKPEGKGTGLGLSTVYGIVRQSGGSVTVYSEPGHGTTFKVYFPRVDEAVETGTEPAPPAAAPRGSETILVVEDAESLRQLLRELLESAGYTVLDADGPERALALLADATGRIDLVLTDMVMPKMSGTELRRRLASLQPEIRVVFMSGYSNQAVAEEGALESGAPFLQKPFTLEALTRTIRKALDEPARPPAG